jgi:hypothetical protein
MSNMSTATAPPRPNRRPSATNLPPMLPSGVPVRAGHAKANQFHQSNQPKYHHHQQHHHQPRPIPSPHPSPRTHTDHTHTRHPSSSKPSPLMSSDEGSLKESTRVNIGMRPHRQGTAESESGFSDSLKSPKDLVIETPKEQYSAQVRVRDELEVQFDHLLVGCLSIQL